MPEAMPTQLPEPTAEPTPQDIAAAVSTLKRSATGKQVFNTVSDPDAPKEWEARGTVFSIVVGVLATCGSHIVYLGAMFAMMKTSDSRLLSCSTAKYPTMGTYGVFVCDWTKAYMECFPELALTICLLIVGRNLLQQRLYYGFLMRGAVLQYKSKNMFTDGMLRIFLWCYVNAMLHLVLLMWLIHQGGGDKMFAEELKESKGGTKADFLGLHHQSFSGHQSLNVGESDLTGNAFGFSDAGGMVHPLHDPALKSQIRMLVELIGFFVIPATLFLIYLFTGYDIEGSLVPLSQYFYDARAAEKKWSAKASCELTVLDDDATKLLIEHHQDFIHDAASTVSEALDEIIDIYMKEGHIFENLAFETGQNFNGIAKAHWPCTILISEDATELGHKAFKGVWLTFITISLTGQLFMMYSLSRLILADYRRYQQEGLHPLVHLAVVVGNISVEIFGITVNVATITQWLWHDSLRKRDKEKDWVKKSRATSESGSQPAPAPTGIHASDLSAVGVAGVLHT